MAKLKTNALLLICAGALCACASPQPAPMQPVVVEPPHLAPAPADVMMKREPNFLARLLNFLSDSPLGADAVVHQLTACQAVITADRAIMEQ